MKILFFTRRFYPQIGGVETHVLKISEQLIKDGHAVIIITEELEPSYYSTKFADNLDWQMQYRSDKLMGKEKSADKSIKTDNKKEGDVNTNQKPTSEQIVIHRIPKVKNKWSKKFIIWLWLWKHKELIKEADLVHCHDVFFWYFPFRLFFPNKPAFVTFHGYEGKFPPSKKAIVVRKLSEKLAKGNICVGEFIQKWYGTKPNFVTYGGIDRNLKFQMSNVKFQIPKKLKKSLKIVFLGRLERDTGIPTYLAALEKLKEKKIAYQFEACGDGSLREDADKYGKVLGSVENPEPYIAHADIVFASSYLSMLQALVCGKLNIAVYDNPLKEDYLKLSPFNDRSIILNTSQDMFNFIEQYHTEPQSYSSQLKESQAWALQQSWKNVTELYYQLWQTSK